MIDFKSKDIVTKMTIIGIAAAALIIVIASVVIITTFGNDNQVEAEIPVLDVTTEEDATVAKADKVFERALAVVKHVDDGSGQLMIYDIEKLKLVTLKMDSSIVIKDEYGTDIALSQIDVGDMVETKYDTLSMKPENVKITAVTWERKDVSNMVVDVENQVIRISNDVYSFNDELVTSEGGSPFDIGELSTADEALIRGYQDMVWSVVLINGHGNIKLINHDIFVGGQLEIGNKISYTIEDEMMVPIAAGVHQVVVSKDNMAPYVVQVLVEEDKEVVIDLSEAQPQVGEVEFVMLQEDVVVYLDEEVVTLDDNLVLDFGTYTIRAEKENYVTWERELVLAQAYLQFEIDLDKTPSFVYFNYPEEAEVYFDNIYIGTVPTQVVFSPGSHTVQFRQDGFRTSEVINFSWEDDGSDRYITGPELLPLAPEPEPEPEAEAEPETETGGTVTDDIYDNGNDESEGSPEDGATDSSN